jgi:hypothetical protein
MATPPHYTAEHWRERAEEARAHAEQMKSPDAKQALYKIAEIYDQLAEQAERNTENSKPPS